MYHINIHFSIVKVYLFHPFLQECTDILAKCCQFAQRAQKKSELKFALFVSITLSHHRMPRISIRDHGIPL
jgi:hypothetical protein